MPAPESSRTLLLPGPQPPLSHFGATLLKQVIATGVRYALHNLGAAMPEGAPVRILRLRVYLDRDKLRSALGGAPAADTLLGALLEPAGEARSTARGALGGLGALRGAALFHHLRLRLRGARAPAPPPAPEPGSPPAELWRHLHSTVDAFQTTLNDAFLGELLASLDRRGARARGRRPAPCLGRQAHAGWSGRRPDLASLGIADPMVGPWSESPGVLEQIAARRGDLVSAGASPRRHPLRGELREAYRRALNPIRAAYLRLAADARRRGLIEEPGDAFFLPFDLSEDLTADPPADWLRRAVASNRGEYQSLLQAPSPPDTIEEGPPKMIDDRHHWLLAPLWPLA